MTTTLRTDPTPLNAPKGTARKHGSHADGRGSAFHRASAHLFAEILRVMEAVDDPRRHMSRTDHAFGEWHCHRCHVRHTLWGLAGRLSRAGRVAQRSEESHLHGGPSITAPLATTAPAADSAAASLGAASSLRTREQVVARGREDHLTVMLLCPSVTWPLAVHPSPCGSLGHDA